MIRLLHVWRGPDAAKTGRRDESEKERDPMLVFQVHSSAKLTDVRQSWLSRCNAASTALEASMEGTPEGVSPCAPPLPPRLPSRFASAARISKPSSSQVRTAASPFSNPLTPPGLVCCWDGRGGYPSVRTQSGATAPPSSWIVPVL